MSKATTQLMKRYVAVLNITNGNRYLGSEDVMELLKSDYSIDAVRAMLTSIGESAEHLMKK
jgi:uncharacterized protein with HEPN domain